MKFSLKKSLPPDWQSDKLAFQYLMKAAESHGYEIRRFSEADGAVAVHQIWDPRTERGMMVLKSNSYPDLSKPALDIARDKWLTQQVLSPYGIPFPKGFSFDEQSDLPLLLNKFFEQKLSLRPRSQSPSNIPSNSPTLVVKPRDAAHGEDVYFVKTPEEALQKARTIVERHGPGLVQLRVSGQDLRIQVVGARLFAACLRLPAHVTGDGAQTIAQLIDAKNQDKFEANRIITDAEVLERLNKQGFDLNSIPEPKQHVALREASNIGLGGDPVDVTDRLHPDYQALVKTIAKVLHVRTFAIDAMVHDETQPIMDGQVHVIEVNAPCMWAHHHFALGQRRNVALALLDAHFHPESFDPHSDRYRI